MAKEKVKKFKIPRTQAAKSKPFKSNPEMNDKLFSFDHVRKCHDAILFGASTHKAILCNSYCVEMGKSLDNHKKEASHGEKNVLTNENEVDPFTFTLCMLN